jgi:hypothetical protein
MLRREKESRIKNHVEKVSKILKANIKKGKGTI